MKLKCMRMVSNRRLDMYEFSRNGAPENISGESVAQKSLRAFPCVVAITKIRPKKRRNSSHVNGSDRFAFVAGRTVSLKKVTGRK